MCELVYKNYRYIRRHVDIVKCHCFHTLRENESATAKDYEKAIEDSYLGADVGIHSVKRSLLDYDVPNNEKIVAWRLTGIPMFQKHCDIHELWPYKQIANRCGKLWNLAAEETKAAFSFSDNKYTCIVCGLTFNPYVENKTTAYNLKQYSNSGLYYNCCNRPKCRKIQHLGNMLKKSFYRAHQDRKPLILYLLQEAIKNGGNNEVFRWLEKNAFRDARKVCQRGNRRGRGKDHRQSGGLDSEKRDDRSGVSAAG